MRTAIGWTVLGTLIPGVGYIRAGRKVLGGVILGVFALAVGSLVTLAIVNRSLLIRLALDPNVLLGIAIGATALGLAWVVVVATTHLALRPPRPSVSQRAAGAALVGFLSLAVAAPMAYATSVSYTAASSICKLAGAGSGGLAEALLECKQGGRAVTLPDPPADDTWEGIDRVNILVLGADENVGDEPFADVRVDTNIVVSIDTQTGATTLISIPRNVGHMPFPKDSPLYKYFGEKGFWGVKDDNSAYMLNAMWTNLPRLVPKDILGNPDTLPSDAMKLSIGEATGLEISYFVMVNIDGFKKIIDALGGITVNINYTIPKGGVCDTDLNGRRINVSPFGILEPGPDQHLSGANALWYARGRYNCPSTKYPDINFAEHNSNASRMARQMCMINAVARQVTSETLLLKYQSLAETLEDMLLTDIPPDMLQPLTTLAMKIRGTKLSSYKFDHAKDGFNTTTPDFDVMRKLVKKALKKTDTVNNPSPEPSAESAGTGSTAGTEGTPAADVLPGGTPDSTPSTVET
ncbi:MAG: LCP family protein, partial [Propionibacteriaceae bacterium]|nr:LCP family protein [Propionibacteriaceae bacterium]